MRGDRLLARWSRLHVGLRERAETPHLKEVRTAPLRFACSQYVPPAGQQPRGGVNRIAVQRG